MQAVGGLKLNVRDRIPIGGVGGPVTGYIEPGVQRLNGFETLWFARSRESADDYSRMARQKCVMNAMLQQLSPRTVITKFEKIAAASTELITTDLPASELGRFAELAMKARSHAGEHRLVRAAGDQHRRARHREDPRHGGEGDREVRGQGRRPAPAAKKKDGFSKAAHDSTVGGSIGNLSEGYAANAAKDLSSAC